MKKMLGVVAGLFYTQLAFASQAIYFGETLGIGENVRLDSFPEATSARNSFLSGLTGVGTESFETYKDNADSPVALDFSGIGLATLSGAGRVTSTLPGTTNGNGRYATDGDKYWQSIRDFTIDFDSPVSAFGFMGIDIGDRDGHVRLSLTTTGGSTQVINIDNTLDSPDGSVLFWGIIDSENAFSRITFENTAAGVDSFGFDQMTVGSPVPEPKTYTLMLAGLGLIGCMVYRREKMDSTIVAS